MSPYPRAQTLTLLIMISAALIIVDAAHAEIYPASWRRARTQVTNAFTAARAGVRGTDASGVDWRPAYRALLRARRTARGPRGEQYLTFVVAGGIAEAARRSPCDLGLGELLAHFDAEVSAHPEKFTSGPQFKIFARAAGAFAVNLIAGLGGMGVFTYHLAVDVIPHHNSDDFMLCVTGVTATAVAVMVAQGVIGGEMRWDLERAEGHAVDCATLLSDLAHAPPAFAARVAHP